ncbi:hypothetical protein CDAR_532601 [Caerostris darwini]|uniref:Uncharacterized protein n=1 Tax=Caerostris darwini TaxID=1538125 RepID=A0AAV4VW11_9ARAC|nr:hypothetical protein CDAR_532601 [Caerostris darwini]
MDMVQWQFLDLFREEAAFAQKPPFQRPKLHFAVRTRSHTFQTDSSAFIDRLGVCASSEIDPDTVLVKLKHKPSTNGGLFAPFSIGGELSSDLLRKNLLSIATVVFAFA